MCRCTMLCYHNIDHLWHGNIYTNTITQKRIPCAGAQCCAVTTLTTSDTEKVQKCHPVQWLTATQNIHFWVPVIVKFTHYRYKLPYTGLYPAQGPRGKRPELESQLTSKAASSKKTQILAFFSRSAGFLPDLAPDLYLGLWPSLSGSLPASSRSLRPLAYKTHTTLLSWEGCHVKRIPNPNSHPWAHCQTRSYRAYQAFQTPLFSNPLMLPFDAQVCNECQICLRFHRILKVILEMAFSAHCTQIWKLHRISMTIISEVARKCIWCCHRVQRCVTAPYHTQNTVWVLSHLLQHPRAGWLTPLEPTPLWHGWLLAD